MSDSGAGRPRAAGRRGSRRVVAPATSGQSEDIESQPFTPAALGDEGDTPSDEGHDDATAERPGGAPGSKKANEAGKHQRLSARDRWILDQRPPHWD